MVYETYSKRQKVREQAGQPEVYQYDTLPAALRVQIIHIWKTTIGLYRHRVSAPPSNAIWSRIHDTLTRELGVFSLADLPSHQDHAFARCQRFLLQAHTRGALDIIELSFRCIDRLVRKWTHLTCMDAGVSQSPDSAITELNHRFREHGVGYQYERGEIVRMDSAYLHAEAVRPALVLLAEPGFLGASQEFMCAHDHHCNGRSKEAITEALKAFESTMKAICDARGWSYTDNPNATHLIDVILDNGLIPCYVLDHLGALRQTLVGLPTVRNRSTSSHGQGATPVDVPPHLAAYALHLAATNIVFLVQAHKAMK